MLLAILLRKSACSDSSPTFYWMHIHYTHGQWCCRSSSKSAVSSLDRLRSTGFTSGASTQNKISNPLQDLLPPPGNCLSPQEQMNSRSGLFHVCPSHSVNHVTLLNMTSLNSEIPLHYGRPPELCHTLKFMNTAVWFYSWIFTKTVFLFPREKYVCVCVCGCLILIHMHQQVIRDCCASLSWEAAFHLFLKCSREWFFSFLIQLLKLAMQLSKVPITKKKARLNGKLQNRVIKYGGS